MEHTMLHNATNDNSTNNSTGQPLQGGFPPANVINIVILSILIPLIALGNTLVCVVFIKYQRLRTATNCFIFSLAISDLTVGLLLIPFWIAFSFIGFDSAPELFQFYQILDITCTVASMANLASVSMERWYGVSYPFLHMRMTPKKAAFMAACSWLYALSLALLYLINIAAVGITMIVMGLVVPFLIMVVCYTGIAVKIRKKAVSPCRQSGREWKTIRTLMFITGVFLVCYLPFIVGSIVTSYCEPCTRYVHQTPLLHTFPKILHYANSFVNPIIYALFSPSFQAAYKQLFCGVQITRANGVRQHSHGRLSLDPTTNTGISMTRRSHLINWNVAGRSPSLQNNNHDRTMRPDKDSHV